MLIGIVGPQGSGKTTVAEYLAAKWQFQDMTLAEPLKAACMALFDLDREQLYGSLADKTRADPRWFGVTPRQIMQFVGTDLMRRQMSQLMPEVGDNIFVHRFRIWYQRQSPGARISVSDVRFQNEAAMIRALGGKLWRIKRTTDMQDAHVSETECHGIDVDLEIDNNADIAALYQTVDRVITTILPNKDD